MACGFLLIPRKIFPTPYAYTFIYCFHNLGFYPQFSLLSEIYIHAWCAVGLPGASMVKNPPANEGEKGSIPGSGMSPGEGHGNPIPVFLPGKSHGQRSQPGRLQSMGSQRVRHSRACRHTHGAQEGPDFLSLGSSFMTVIFVHFYTSIYSKDFTIGKYYFDNRKKSFEVKGNQDSHIVLLSSREE